jgi:hypothetical protein
VSTVANLAQPTSCPSGFIPVPGSPTYGTSGFCIMKYEAKHYNASTTVPVSTANNTPWVSIAQSLAGANNDAMEISQNAVDQSGNPIAGAHLITEAEWMTVAQNVLSVPSNWKNNAVGNDGGAGNYIYQGHIDEGPNEAIAASINVSTNVEEDNTGTYGLQLIGTVYGENSKRTLILTNGEVIWDFSGNVWELTQEQIGGGQQPGLTSDTGYEWHQWNEVGLIQNGLLNSSTPSSSGLTNITWQTSSGIGRLWSDYYEDDPHSFSRGGFWDYGSGAGVLSLNLSYSTSYPTTKVGFRVVAPVQ